MALAELNVQIGAIYKDFDRNLKQVERSMMRFSAQMSGVGNNLTTSLTLPLAAFSVKAIQAAGDSEALKLAMESTMQSAGYSIEAARVELDKLRQAALAPGLDLKQAVEGSLRLQGVGFSAEKARGILMQLANAISMTGGSAQQLDSVTKQFSQMISKGRIMQEDLGVIQENMPAISQAMEKAFGTKSAEKLREMGVSAEQFVDGVTKQLALLPRVEGGIKNALTNAGSALTQFFAGVGEEINKTLELTGKSEQLGDTLNDLGTWFRTLDGETKKTIITYGLYLAAAGPVIKVTSALVGGAGVAVTAFKGITGAIIGPNGMIASVTSAVASFRKMDNMWKATSIGIAIAAVGALVYAYSSLSDTVSKAFEAQTIFAEASKEVNSQSAAEIVTLNNLFSVLKSDIATREEKQSAIKKLNDSYPEMLGNLNLEKSSVSDLTTLQNSLTKSIINRIATEKRSKLLDEQGTKIVEARLKLADIEARGVRAFAGEMKANRLEFWGLADGEVSDEVARLKDEIKQAESTANQLDKQFNSVFGTITTGADDSAAKMYELRDSEIDIDAINKKIAASWNANSKSGNAVTESSKSRKKAIDEEKDAFDKYLEGVQKTTAAQQKAIQVAESLGVGVLAPLPQAGGLRQSNTQQGPTIRGEITGFTGSNEMLDYITVMSSAIETQLVPQLTKAQLATQNMKLAFADMAMAFQNGGDATKLITDSVLGSIISMTDEGSTNMADFGRAALASALKVAKAYAVQGIFAAVSKALSTVPFPLNLAAAGIAAGAAGALLNGLANKIQPPALAKGGLAYGMTQAIVGDNPDAHVNPEVIAPLKTLQGMIGSTGPTDVRVHGVIRGRDMLLLQELALKDRNRTR